MDISFIVVLWIIITIVQTINERKKTPPPPEIPPEFEIPTLANDPTKPAEFEEIDLAEMYQQKKISTPAKVQSETVKEKPAGLDLTPAAMMNSIIMNEILDKPKALRRKKF